MGFARGSVVCTLCVLGAIATAHADSPKLADARRAIDEVRYDDAQRLLVDALADGGNSPQALADIYQLSARTAIALHQPELAEQYYRRWLALQPNAQLPDGVAPKLRERFVDAQAYMAAHGRLSVVAKRAPAGIDVIVESDPLAMAASASLDQVSASPIALDRPAHFATDAAQHEVSVLDEHRNELVAIDVPAGGLVVQVAPLAPVAPPPAPQRSLFAQPLAWAVPAVVLAGVAVGFGLAAHNANDELTTIAGSPSSYYYDQATPVRDRRDRDALVTNIALGAAGACTAAAIVLLIVHHGSSAATPAPGGIALAW